MIRRELAIFLIVGLVTVAVDFSIYRILVFAVLNEVGIAKGLGFIGGSVFAYFANRYWTFKEQDVGIGSFSRFAVVYIISLGANILINDLCIFMLGIATNAIPYQQVIFLAFLLATTVSATLNFLGMKYFVFANCLATTPSTPS